MNVRLPSYIYKYDITDAMKETDTLVITAETGSGKSTQVPQYLFEAGYDVIVTQPRRIACITLADRVAEEMGDLSNVVGYHTAFESNKTPDTKILFCTDGLQMAKGIKDVENTILVIDEVHEWNLNIETLIAWIKKFRKDGGRIKVILMSATVESQELCDFYEDAKCINIPGRNYEVRKIHSSDPVSSEIYKYASAGKNVLAFVEGKKEISDTINELQEMKLDAEILPLHGELSTHDQNLCFKKYDKAKVVISTNIAQTSVTIPDIDVVVDNGKEKRIEVHDGIEGLFMNYISTADCLQRAGRAGRTKNGIYVLCSYTGLHDRKEYSTPEIQRLVLDKVVLKLASVNIDARALEFFHQPSMESIEESIKTLIMLGALDKNANITSLGKRMIQIPVSVRFSKMIIESEKYHCTGTIIKAVAILEVGSLIKPKTLRKNAFFNDDFVSYADFTTETKSDILAEISIYNDITAYKFPNLKEAGINVKSFGRIKEIIHKLNDIMEIKDEEVNPSNIIKCIAAGIPDQLYKYLRYSYECVDINGNHYKMSKSTCIYGSGMIFGFPRTITYKDRWGYNNTMDIITMASKVSIAELIEIVGEENIRIEYDEGMTSYDSITNAFAIPYKKLYGMFVLVEDYKIVKSGDPEYARFERRFSNLINAENAKRVIINNHVYEIQFSYWHKHPYIEITKQDVMESDIKTLNTSDGKQIQFQCGLYCNMNLDIIRQKFINEEIKAEEEKVMYSIPRGKTGSVKLVINEYLDKLGKIDLSIPKYNITKFKWIGLVIEKESVAFDTFESEEEADISTNEALQMLIGKVIRQDYSDKHFVIKRNGKKIETKLTQSAKDEFHEFYHEIINETTKDNFAEQLEFLDEIFNECIQKFA